MKAFRADFAKQSKINCNGFEFCVEMIKHIRLNKAKVIETPIQVIYTEDTLNKGQNLMSGFKMLGKLLKIFG